MGIVWGRRSRFSKFSFWCCSHAALVCGEACGACGARRVAGAMRSAVERSRAKAGDEGVEEDATGGGVFESAAEGSGDGGVARSRGGDRDRRRSAGDYLRGLGWADVGGDRGSESGDGSAKNGGLARPDADAW